MSLTVYQMYQTSDDFKLLINTPPQKKWIDQYQHAVVVVLILILIN